MKRVAGETKDETIVSVVEIVGLAIVAVEPAIVVVMIHVKDIEVAIRITKCVKRHL